MPKKSDRLIQEILHRVHNGDIYLLYYKPVEIIIEVPQLYEFYQLKDKSKRQTFNVFWNRLKKKQEELLMSSANTPTTPFPGVSTPSYHQELQLQESRQAHELRMRTMDQELRLAMLANVTTAIKTNEAIAKTNESITVAQFATYAPRPSENATERLFDREQFPSPLTGVFLVGGTPAPTAVAAATAKEATSPTPAHRSPSPSTGGYGGTPAPATATPATESTSPPAFALATSSSTPFGATNPFGNDAPNPSFYTFSFTPKTPGARFDFGGGDAHTVNSPGGFHFGGTPAPAAAVPTTASSMTNPFGNNAPTPRFYPFGFTPKTPGARFDFGGGDEHTVDSPGGSHFGGTPAPAAAVPTAASSNTSALHLPTASLPTAHKKRSRNDDGGPPKSRRRF